MVRSSSILLPALLVAFPLAAQLTPEQRLEREWAAVATTIGRTREIEAETRAQNDPLRGLRCAGDASTAYYPCVSRNGWRVGAPVGEVPPVRGHPAPIVYGAFGPSAQAKDDVHPLTQQELAIPRAAPTQLTLVSPIGRAHRPLMIETEVQDPSARPLWTRVREEEGDAQGRYVVPFPAFDSGRYQLRVAIYDLDAPAAPFSVTVTPLVVK